MCSSSSCWCSPSINSTFSLYLNRTMNDAIFSSLRYSFWCLPSIDSTLSDNMNGFMKNLKKIQFNWFVKKWHFRTSVALWALRLDVVVCHVSTRLLPWTWIGRWISCCLVDRTVLSDICQVSTRLCPIIWTGLWIYISIIDTHWQREKRFILQ